MFSKFVIIWFISIQVTLCYKSQLWGYEMACLYDELVLFMACIFTQIETSYLQVWLCLCYSGFNNWLNDNIMTTYKLRFHCLLNIYMSFPCLYPKKGMVWSSLICNHKQMSYSCLYWYFFFDTYFLIFIFKRKDCSIELFTALLLDSLTRYGRKLVMSCSHVQFSVLFDKIWAQKAIILPYIL